MSTNIFVSFDHDDANQVNGFKLLKNNPNHPLYFRDHSLREPITNKWGSPIKYPPSDPRSKPVRDEIIGKFSNASKLIVLIGQDTHTSEWVDWEVKTFYNMKYPLSADKAWRRIRGMNLKGQEHATMPSALGGRSTQPMNWDPDGMDTWIDQDPDR